MQKEISESYRFDVAPGEFPKDFRARVIVDDVVTDQPIRSVHIHDFLELGYCHEGNGIFIIGKKVLPFRGGDAVIINNHEAHRAQSRKGSSSRWSWAYLDVSALLSNFTMDFELFDYSSFWGDGFNNIISPDKKPQLCDAVRRIIEELRYQGHQYQRVTRALVLYLMTLLHRSESQPLKHDGDPMPHAQRIKPALDMISSHYADKVSIGELASACNMSIPHFRRIFQKAVGKNPLEYLIYLRLNMACLELRSTDKSAERVATETGFPTFSCFLRKFKAAYGTTPHKWRKQ